MRICTSLLIRRRVEPSLGRLPSRSPRLQNRASKILLHTRASKVSSYAKSTVKMAFDARGPFQFYRPPPTQNEVAQVLDSQISSTTTRAIPATKGHDENDNVTDDIPSKQTITTSKAPQHRKPLAELSNQSPHDQAPLVHQPSHQLEKSKSSSVAKVQFDFLPAKSSACDTMVELPWDGNLGDGQWAVDCILAHESSKDGVWYCLQFSGIDPDTGKKWAPKWEPTWNVGRGLKAEYHARIRACMSFARLQL